METRARTLVKSVLWTALGLVVMAGVGLAFTGSLAVGGGFLSFLVYERVWSGIRWGRHV